MLPFFSNLPSSPPVLSYIGAGQVDAALQAQLAVLPTADTAREAVKKVQLQTMEDIGLNLNLFTSCV